MHINRRQRGKDERGVIMGDNVFCIYVVKGMNSNSMGNVFLEAVWL